MREYILENLSQTSSLMIGGLILSNIAAVMISLFIMFTYKISYSGIAYSRKFNVSLGMLTIITTLIMNVISNNIALSLGMVGALSIIRFRTAVKDVRDATFIFWCIGVGICCGVGQYFPALVGSITLMLFLMVMRQIKEEGNYMIVIHCEIKAQSQVNATMSNYFNQCYKLRAQTTSKENVELIYETPKKAYIKGENKYKTSLGEKLIGIEGVMSINQIEQTEDIVR